MDSEAIARALAAGWTLTYHDPDTHMLWTVQTLGKLVEVECYHAPVDEVLVLTVLSVEEAAKEMVGISKDWEFE